MTIGVDGGALSVTDDRLKVGVYKVTLRLLEYLSRIDTHNNYRLFTFNRLGEGIKKQLGDKIEERLVLPRFGWNKISLPIQLRLHPVDLFLGMSQSLPRNTSYNIGLVYDLAYLQYPDAYPGSLNKLRNVTDSLVAQADRILTVSAAVKSDLVKTYDYPAAKVTVCHLGVDPGFTLKGPVYRGTRPYMLFVGAMKAIKNVPTLIAAFARFSTMVKDIYDLYLVGGDFWPDPAIGDAIESSGLKGRIKRLGHVPDPILAQYYRGATGFIVPSLYEGFCLPAVEAMASGCPVIVTNHGSLPEIVGDAGLRIDPSDPVDIARAMTTLTQKPSVREKLKKEGLKRAGNFRWEKSAQTVLSVINSSLQGKK